MFSFDRSLSDWPSVIEKNYLSFFNKKRKQRKNKRNTNQIPLKTFGFEIDVRIRIREGRIRNIGNHFLSHKLNYGGVSREIGRKRAVSRNANEFALNAFLSLSNLPINRLILADSLLIAPSGGRIARHLNSSFPSWRARENRSFETLFSRRQVVKGGRNDRRERRLSDKRGIL